MATREENIKKINEELEKLSDEQLEQVAGGSIRHSFITASDEPKGYQIGAPEPFSSVPTEIKINFKGGEFKKQEHPTYPKEYPIGAPKPFSSVPIEERGKL